MEAARFAFRWYFASFHNVQFKHGLKSFVCMKRSNGEAAMSDAFEDAFLSFCSRLCLKLFLVYQLIMEIYFRLDAT
jgi:hypothetical protein